jgi:histidyl-tRNA synthetase
LPGISGVGISFGADRIFDVLNTLDLYPKEAVSGTQLMFVNFGEEEARYSMTMARKCREAGIKTEVYPDNVKMKKQMAYANAKSIPFVAMAGEDEMAKGIVSLKNMETGEQVLANVNELVSCILK